MVYLNIYTFQPLKIKIMSVNINYLKKTNHDPSANLVLYVNEKFDTKGLRKYLSETESFLI